MSWDPLRPWSRSSLCITAVKCALLCVWGLGFRTLFFLKYQADQSCICSGESRGRWFSVHIFTRLFLDRTLGKYPAAEIIPRVLLCFNSFSFFLSLSGNFHCFLFIFCIITVLENGGVYLHQSETKAWDVSLNRGHNELSSKPVSLCSHYSAFICPFRNPNRIWSPVLKYRAQVKTAFFPPLINDHWTLETKQGVDENEQIFVSLN